MTIDSWDRGVIAKLERAFVLRDELRDEQEKLRGGGDPREYASLNNERDGDDPQVWMEWRLVKAQPSIPLAFAALLGDVIQNLRAVLEYSTWAAASEEARSSNPTQISFPLHDKPEDYLKWAGKASGWFNGAILRVMECAQPYRADEGSLHPLRILKVLSNTDKHRLLNVVDYAHIGLGIHIAPMPPTYDWWTARGPVEQGDVLARLSFPRPADALRMDISPSFGWYEAVAYDEPDPAVRWLGLDEMMNAICPFTAETVSHMAQARVG